MIVVLIGPPGAGKSKQSELLRDREHLEWLYVGKLLRDQNDPEIERAMEAGRLVDDKVVNDLVGDFISSVPADKVVVIDGFPRHLPQAEWLVSYAAGSPHTLSAVIHLTAPAEVSHERLVRRGREDDKPQAITRRLREYEQDIAPVIGYFERARVTVHPVDGNRSVEAVFADIEGILSDVHQG